MRPKHRFLLLEIVLAHFRFERRDAFARPLELAAHRVKKIAESRVLALRAGAREREREREEGGV